MDLIVLAVHQHEGRIRWLEKSVGKPIARGAGQMTLLIPYGVEGFVCRAERLDLAPEHPYPSHEQTPPSAERGSHCTSNQEPPIATWHGDVAPRRTCRRNALREAAGGHRLDLAAARPKPASRPTRSCKQLRSFARI